MRGRGAGGGPAARHRRRKWCGCFSLCAHCWLPGRGEGQLSLPLRRPLYCCFPPCAPAPSLPFLRPPLTPGSMEVMEGPLNLVSSPQRVVSVLGSFCFRSPVASPACCRPSRLGGGFGGGGPEGSGRRAGVVPQRLRAGCPRRCALWHPREALTSPTSRCPGAPPAAVP